MNTVRRSELKGHWRQVLDLPPAQQFSYVESLAASDPEMAAEVRSLLEAEARSGDFLEKGFAPALPLRFGPWRPVRELGVGGMGRVFHSVRAVGDFEQQAAIKTLRPELLGSEAGRRFQRERRILARLDHPHIARLLDGGEDDQQTPYLAMEFVEGQSIDRWAQGRDRKEILALFLQVCDALDHAHRHLIIHCDLKPSNILVNASGQAKLLDFGIARLISPDAEGATIAHLTPQYASPEQLRNQPLSTATDIYSLGVVLFKLLTGQLPYAATTARSTDPVALAQEICDAPPAVLGPAFPRDLAAIVSKALAKNPADRYSSAQAFAQDLRNFLAGRAIEARPLPAAHELWRFLVRHKYVTLAAAAAFLALGLTTGWALRERFRAQALLLEARQVSGSLLWEVEKALKLESPSAARRILLQRTSAYLNRISQRETMNRSLAVEHAESYRLLGDALGETKDGEAAYARGLAILEPFRGAPEVEFTRAKILTESLDLARVQEAWKILTALESQINSIPRAQWTAVASATQERFGVILVRDGNYAGVEAAWRQALALAEECRRLSPGESSDTLVARMQRRMGAISSRSRGFAAALAHYQASAAIEESAYANRPGQTNSANLATSLSEVAYALRALGRLEEALAAINRSEQLRRRLYQDEPRSDYYRFALSNILLLKADALHRLKRAEECGPLLHEAERIAVEMKDGGLQHAQALAYIADWEKDRPGRRSASRATAAQALAILDRLKAQNKLPAFKREIYLKLQELSR
jgi:predicted Ser/Thr protein kinase